MRDMQCAICSGDSEYKILYEKRFDPKTINEKTFSARRTPDRYHYRIARCKRCGLVFSTPIFKAEEIERLYRGSRFTYESVTEDLKKTYGFYLGRIEELVPSKGRLLEVGCGNGFFLEKALEMGYQNVYGVEPSSEAVSEASPFIAKNIINEVFASDYYEESYFDVICFFQTLDHIIDPNDFLSGCRYCLKEGGIILCITHNIDSFFSKLLRQKCPMIDIEHIYLFNKTTLGKIFLKNGFSIVEVFDVANTFPVEYYIQMLPLHKGMKNALMSFVSRLGLKDKRMTMKMGNIGIIAKKG